MRRTGAIVTLLTLGACGDISVSSSDGCQSETKKCEDEVFYACVASSWVMTQNCAASGLTCKTDKGCVAGPGDAESMDASDTPAPPETVDLETDAPETCQSDCTDKKCGDDGCGGICGSCPNPCNGASHDDALCHDGACDTACCPSCAGKTCGPDGCGGTCGSCANPCDGSANADFLCQTDGTCATPCCPSCVDMSCGPDGCGGTCGACSGSAVCSGEGKCVGCIGPLDCPDSHTCEANVCVCQPDCAGKECGPDGCGKACGSCATGFACNVGKCIDQCPDEAKKGCKDGDLYWFDACGEAGEKAAECDLGCLDGACAPGHIVIELEGVTKKYRIGQVSFEYDSDGFVTPFISSAAAWKTSFAPSAHKTSTGSSPSGRIKVIAPCGADVDPADGYANPLTPGVSAKNGSVIFMTDNEPAAGSVSLGEVFRLNFFNLSIIENTGCNGLESTSLIGVVKIEKG